MNNSNYTLRFSRSYQEATGKRIRHWEFKTPSPETGDKAVVIASLAVAILLPVCAYVFGWHIGG
jgi:hypothetical protein